MSLNHFKTQLASLQKSLLSSQVSLAAKEEEASDMRKQLQLEMASALEAKEKEHNELMEKERENHLQHVNRLSEQFLDQQEQRQLDEGELEATRIKQLKMTLEEMHEKEKENMLLSAQKEKEMMREEFEREKAQLEASFTEMTEKSRKQLEAVANEQIKQYHNQYVAAHSSLSKEKEEIEKKLTESLKECMELRGTVSALERERNDSVDLEKMLHNWKEKASGLESRLQQESVDHTEMLLAKDDTIKQLEKEYERETSSHNEDIKRLGREKEELRERLEESVAQLETRLREKEKSFQEEKEIMAARHEEIVKQLEEEHSTQISHLEAEKSTEVSQLEESISESTDKSQASLDFAVKHMNELQTQLNAYRNQETSYKSQLERLEQEKTQEMERLREEHMRILAQLQEERSQSENEKDLKINDLTSSLDQLHTEKGELEESLSSIKAKVAQDETDHTTTVAKLRQSHSEEIADIKNTLNASHNEELERMRRTLQTEKGTELEQLKQKNKTDLETLKNSLSSTSQEELATTKMKIMELETKCQQLEREYQDSRVLQERLHNTEKDLKSSRVSLSLIESELREKEVTLGSEINSLKANAAQLEVEINELKSANEKLKENYDGVVQEKEDEIATQTCRVSSLQLKLNELTQELEGERNAHTNNESDKLVKVHAQLAEAKERCDLLKEEWSAEEATLQGKLQDKERALTNERENWKEKEKEHKKKATKLKKDLETKSTKLQEMETLVEELKSALTAANKEVESTQDTIRELTASNGVLGQTNNTLEVRIREYQDQLDNLRTQLQEKLVRILVFVYVSRCICMSLCICIS